MSAWSFQKSVSDKRCGSVDERTGNAGADAAAVDDGALAGGGGCSFPVVTGAAQPAKTTRLTTNRFRITSLGEGMCDLYDRLIISVPDLTTTADPFLAKLRHAQTSVSQSIRARQRDRPARARCFDRATGRSVRLAQAVAARAAD